jgi:hypothetical protein
MLKRAKLNADSASELPEIIPDPPNGFHWYGDVPRLMIETGAVTKPIYRSTDDSRLVKYQHLYYRHWSLDTNGGRTLHFLCCIHGCDRGTIKTGVPMALKGKANESIVFQNYLDHLQRHHEEYLQVGDRDISVKVQKGSSKMQDFFEPANSSRSEVPLVAKSTSSSQSKKTIELWVRIVQAFVEVSAHGPFPLRLVANNAVRDFLIKLQV